jgi:hypothetical protein
MGQVSLMSDPRDALETQSRMKGFPHEQCCQHCRMLPVNRSMLSRSTQTPLPLVRPPRCSVESGWWRGCHYGVLGRVLRGWCGRALWEGVAQTASLLQSIFHSAAELHNVWSVWLRTAVGAPMNQMDVSEAHDTKAKYDEYLRKFNEFAADFGPDAAAVMKDLLEFATYIQTAGIFGNLTLSAETKSRVCRLEVESSRRIPRAIARSNRVKTGINLIKHRLIPACTEPFATNGVFEGSVTLQNIQCHSTKST